MNRTAEIQTSLRNAAMDGRLAAIRSLVAQGADPNARDTRDGTTALHWATTIPGVPSTNAVGVLLRRGADPFALDHAGRTPEDWAKARHNRGALRWFRGRHSIASARRSACAGFSLVEMIGCLAVLATITTVAYAAFGATNETARVAEAQSATFAIQTAASRSYASGGSFGGLTTESAIAEGWLPRAVRGPDGGLKNAWGQQIELGTADVSGPDSDMTITQDVAAAACAMFALQVRDAFNAVHISGVEVEEGDDSPDDIATLCANGADTVTVTLYHSRFPRRG